MPCTPHARQPQFFLANAFFPFFGNFCGQSDFFFHSTLGQRRRGFRFLVRRGGGLKNQSKNGNKIKLGNRLFPACPHPKSIKGLFLLLGHGRDRCLSCNSLTYINLVLRRYRDGAVGDATVVLGTLRGLLTKKSNHRDSGHHGTSSKTLEFTHAQEPGNENIVSLGSFQANTTIHSRELTHVERRKEGRSPPFFFLQKSPPSMPARN